MFGKKFFSTVALSGATVSLVGSAGSFAEEKFPDDGILFKCKNRGISVDQIDDKVDLQSLVDHFRLTREETEKLLKYMRLFLEKYEGLDVDEFGIGCGDPKNFPEVGQLGFKGIKLSTTGGGSCYFFYVSKKGSNFTVFCGQPSLLLTKQDLDEMLTCNLDDIDFSCSKWYWNIF